MALKFDTMISRLSEVEGDEQGVTARQTLTNMIEAANYSVVVCFNEVVQSITDQVSNYSSMYSISMY